MPKGEYVILKIVVFDIANLFKFYLTNFLGFFVCFVFDICKHNERRRLAVYQDFQKRERKTKNFTTMCVYQRNVPYVGLLQVVS